MKIYKYKDNVDTDVIIPARYLNSFDAKELASHAMADIDPTFATTVEKGDIIVAGQNFGCGSSREHAPLCLKTAGVKCVIAKSFARIFYRNSINIGFPIMECEEAADKIEVGDEVSSSADFGVRVCGDSMEPLYLDGQIIWIHKQETLEEGEIGVFFLDGDAYVKKYHQSDSGIQLISLNKKYAPIQVTSGSTLKTFGKVVG